MVGCTVKAICWALRHSENKPATHFYHLILDFISSASHMLLLYKLDTNVTVYCHDSHLWLVLPTVLAQVLVLETSDQDQTKHSSTINPL